MPATAEKAALSGLLSRCGKKQAGIAQVRRGGPRPGGMCRAVLTQRLSKSGGAPCVRRPPQLKTAARRFSNRAPQNFHLDFLGKGARRARRKIIDPVPRSERRSCPSIFCILCGCFRPDSADRDGRRPKCFWASTAPHRNTDIPSPAAS